MNATKRHTQTIEVMTAHTFRNAFSKRRWTVTRRVLRKKNADDIYKNNQINPKGPTKDW